VSNAAHAPEVRQAKQVEYIRSASRISIHGVACVLAAVPAVAAPAALERSSSAASRCRAACASDAELVCEGFLVAAAHSPAHAQALRLGRGEILHPRGELPVICSRMMLLKAGKRTSSAAAIAQRREQLLSSSLQCPRALCARLCDCIGRCAPALIHKVACDGHACAAEASMAVHRNAAALRVADMMHHLQTCAGQ
jgi:hypothetical protein